MSRTKKSGRPVLPVELAGNAALPSAPITPRAAPVLSRRTLLAAGGAIAVLSLTGCGSGGGGGSGGGLQIYALSGRGRRISNAAKLNNANKRFRFPWVALTERAHPGDHSFVVALDVSQAEFNRLFGGGMLVADLRHLPTSAV